jgi:alkylhydroperoxidase family enzyme
MASPHTPPQPHRDALPPQERAAYDSVVARQRGYDYLALARLMPSAHRDAFLAMATGAPGEADPADRVQPYMGAMLNSPPIMELVSELGAYMRLRGSQPGSYSHADREWVDMVLAEELRCWAVYYGHAPDAAAVGVRPEAIRALRRGRDEDLTEDERRLAEFIRAVARGRVTSEAYLWLVERLGRRGAVELTAFTGFLLMTLRLMQAFGAGSEITEEMVDELIDAIAAGEVQLPASDARIPSA